MSTLFLNKQIFARTVTVVTVTVTVTVTGTVLVLDFGLTSDEDL